MANPGSDLMLPPGQRELDEFPRFGVPGAVPAIPADPVIAVTGAMAEPLTVPVAALSELPRNEVVADFHCVAGWTARDVRWAGVAFADLYRLVIAPALPSDASVRYVAFVGLDGYRSLTLLEDVQAPGVLIADTLNGLPLNSDHGAPARLVSPQQYGLVSTKHLARIELHASRPRERYHPNPLIQLGLQVVKPHPRARVWHEERHALLPGRLLRSTYQRLIPVFRALSARGRQSESSTWSGRPPTTSTPIRWVGSRYVEGPRRTAVARRSERRGGVGVEWRQMEDPPHTTT